MAHPTLMSTCSRIARVSVSIPISSGDAANLQDLVVAALNTRSPGLGDYEKHKIMGGRVSAPATAYNAGDDAATQPLAIATTREYTEPCARFLEQTWVKSSAGAVSVVVTVYLSGRER